jgi:Co/Zn/Cd efflux system component
LGIQEVVNKDIMTSQIIDGVLFEDLLMNVGTNSHVLLAESLHMGIDVVQALCTIQSAMYRQASDRSKNVRGAREWTVSLTNCSDTGTLLSFSL